MSLTVVIYLMLYFMFFAGYLKLVFKDESLERAYQVPGGKVVKVIVACLGLLTSLFAFVSHLFHLQVSQLDSMGFMKRF